MTNHTSPLIHAIPFARELKRAMTIRGVSNSKMGAHLGVVSRQVSAWKRGTTLPRQETVIRMSEVLDWDGLVVIALQCRERQCPECRKPFTVDYNTGRRVYCSIKCQHRLRARELREQRANKGLTAIRDLEVTRTVVAAHCRTCEPEGLCRDAGCNLRGMVWEGVYVQVSPLPLIAQRKRA